MNLPVERMNCPLWFCTPHHRKNPTQRLIFEIIIMTREECLVLLQKTKRLRQRLFQQGLDAKTGKAQADLFMAEDLIAQAEEWIESALSFEISALPKGGVK